MWLSLLDLLRASGVTDSPAEPAVQIEDEGSHLLVSAELPLIDKRTVRVQVGESTVALSGWGTREEELEGPNFRRTESSVRSYLRQLPLPARVVPTGAQMAWEGDRLIVRIPKA
jgi:HSP20 family molecular chaperone IbpA